MKTKLISVLTISFLSLLIFVSCESHEQQADAFDQLKEEKMTAPEKEVITAPQKESFKIEKNPLSEWALFRIETEKKIKVNENKIIEIKSIPNTGAKFLRRVVDLEKENNALRQKMDIYQEEEKVRLATFKSELNKEIGAISIELTDASLIEQK